MGEYRPKLPSPWLALQFGIFQPVYICFQHLDQYLYICKVQIGFKLHYINWLYPKWNAGLTTSFCPLFLIGTITKNCTSSKMKYHILHSLFVRGLTTVFLVSGMVEDQENGLHVTFLLLNNKLETPLPLLLLTS